VPDYTVGLDKTGLLAHSCYSSRVNDTKPIRAFIFDVDGVLVHSMPLHTRAWEEYLAGMGIVVDDLERRMHGKRNAELVEDLIAPGLTADDVFNHGAAKERLWRDLLLKEGPQTYQIEGLLHFLHAHKDIPKAVASNAEPENINFVLDNYRLRDFFPIAVNGFDVKRPKPFPDIYLEAARRLEKDPAECLVFEDSPTGLEAALGAGMRVVGIATSTTELPGAALLVNDFADPKLEQWLADRIV
jgi:beta-phosphoglucomutase